MGGIAGIIGYESGEAAGRLAVVEKMLGMIRHRGLPGEMKSLQELGEAGVLEHCRKGDSPFAYDVEADVLVILDGDVFECFDKSIEVGRTDDDARLILGLYKRWRDGFPEKIDGSYSIAVLDGRRKRAILARDRVGSKPLFYSWDGKILVFASEIKAILASGLCPKSIDLISLNNFLSYWYVPNPHTLFQGIKQVQPGHILVYANGEVSEKQYWKFRYDQDRDDKGEEYYKAAFVDVLNRAVKRRLGKFPECGAFLSGGMDTSTVVALMKMIKQGSFKVFTGGFSEPGFSEIPDAKQVSDFFGLEHLSTVVEVGDGFGDLLEKLVWHHDSPFVDTSAVPSYYTAKLAKKHVNVVLSGDFPDQVLGGSGHHVGALEKERGESRLHRMIRRCGINRAVEAIPWSAGTTSFFDKVRRTIYRETFPLEEQRIIMNMPVPELLKRRLYGPELLEINRKNNPMEYARKIYQKVGNSGLLDKLLYFDTLSYATDDLMVKVDRMTMAHGLVAVSPYHDLEFIEFVSRVPAHYKIRGVIRKYIMREAMKSFLPEEVLYKKKKGFDMPIDKWLMTRYSDYVKHILLDPRTLARGYFNAAFMEEMISAFLDGKTDYACGSSATIISLLTLELWHRMFMH